MSAAIVLRPEPGNARTVARLAALGVPAIAQPLFHVRPLAWTAPDACGFDALLLTSANAVRHAGPQLDRLRALPVLAVGTATAAAAAAAGLNVALTGTAGGAALLAAARARGYRRPLHLAGREHVGVAEGEAVPVYASECVPVPAGATRGWTGCIVLLHSARAARRMAALVGAEAVERAGICVAALSPAVRDAAGGGWRHAQAATAPTDAALVALAAALIDPSSAGGNKRGQ